ncbi:hypothetical protein [Anaerocellum diazotrophicum]|uniref:Type IV pilus assembly protein PilO n=1 Tax=Caldicellulosiruptor diazotrophicus TaxID=2806205 RepID=A0ABM7NKV9_9FIRM|nr:hypothetical protein [Caldicellulosiruptor diazotrophicus]BCS80726.1 hypothetical protein CaldiYA01_06860 [Caldicellulosiruptor diazotrophicus]
MQITDRDKKLLVILGMVIIGFLFYNFFYTPYSQKLSNLISEKQQLESKLSEIDQKIAIYNLQKQKLKEVEKDYMSISQKIPPNQDEKFSMLDLQRLAQMVGSKTSDFTFSQRQSLNVTYNNINIAKAYFYSSKQNWQMTYANFKKLLFLQKEFEPLYSVDSISLSGGNNNMITASFEIKFYGFEDTLAPERKWQNFAISYGKGDLFSGGSGQKAKFIYTQEDLKKNEITKQSSALKVERTDNMSLTNAETSFKLPQNNKNITFNEKSASTKDQSQLSEEKVDFNKADFVVTVSTLYSPTTNVTIEKTQKGSIFGAKKKSENAFITIKKEGDKYYYRIGTQASEYPQANKFDILDLQDKSQILIVVFSTPRKYKDDENVVTLKVTNSSDKPVKIYISGDDKQKPRVNIAPSGFDISVVRK